MQPETEINESTEPGFIIVSGVDKHGDSCVVEMKGYTPSCWIDFREYEGTFEIERLIQVLPLAMRSDVGYSLHMKTPVAGFTSGEPEPFYLLTFCSRDVYLAFKDNISLVYPNCHLIKNFM